MSHKCFNGLSSCVGDGSSNSATGVTLPVVEIADVENLTADENAKLTACIGLPCIIKVTVDGVTGCTVAAYQTANGVHNFTFSLLGATASYESTDGITWSAKS